MLSSSRISYRCNMVFTFPFCDYITPYFIEKVKAF
nr:MAG TPA: hypothetical protein [Microviridae sp.]